MSKDQYKGIHDVVNDQGFAMYYRTISNTSAIWKFSDVRVNRRGIKTAKQKED